MKSSKKISSGYQAVDEEQEGLSGRTDRTELRDDESPESQHENRPPPLVEEPKDYDDERRGLVSPRVKLLLNREFVFQSSKLSFYNSLEMRIASPTVGRPPPDGSHRPFLRAPSFKEERGQAKKVKEASHDAVDAMSVTSIFYDEHSMSNHGIHAERHEAQEADACSVGHSIFSSSRGVIVNTRSVESSFPEDPNKWLEAPSVVGESLFMSATSESRDSEPESKYTGTLLDHVTTDNILEQVSYQDQKLWASRSDAEMCTKAGSVFDNTKHDAKMDGSLFDHRHEDEVAGKIQGNDISMENLFPSDPLWSIRREIEKQDPSFDRVADKEDRVQIVSQFKSTNDEDVFPDDPFFVNSTIKSPTCGNKNGNYHTSQYNANQLISEDDWHDEKGGNHGIATYHDELNDVVCKTYLDGNQDENKGQTMEYPSIVGTTPFVTSHLDNGGQFAGSHDEDGDADDEKSRDQSNFSGKKIPIGRSHPEDTDRVKKQATFNGKNPFETDDDVIDIRVCTPNDGHNITFVSSNPFDSSNDDDDDSQPKKEASYVNPFDGSEDDEDHVGPNKEYAFESSNPFDTSNDECRDINDSIANSAGHLNGQIHGPIDEDRAVNEPDAEETAIFSGEEEEEAKDEGFSLAPEHKDVVEATNANNLYTMVMMQSAPGTAVSRSNASSFDQKACPQDSFWNDSPHVASSSQAETGINNAIKSKSNKNEVSTPDNDNVIDDIFSQALLPPSTQGPNMDSDDDDCYLDDDDVRATDDNIEVAESATFDGDVMSDISWQSQASLSPQRQATNVEESDVVVEMASSMESEECYLEDDSRDNLNSTENDISGANAGSKDVEGIVSGHDPSKFVRHTETDNDTVYNTAYSVEDGAVSVADSDQLTCFDEEANPETEPLSSFDEEDGTEGGMSVVGCLHCSALEEEMMIMKAQHQTEILERDLQDEEILSNMVLMKEYIEHLETDHDMLSDQFESNQRILAKKEMEQKLRVFDEELDERASNFKSFELKARLKDLEEENSRLSAILRIGEDPKDKITTQALELRIQELEQERENHKIEESTHQELKIRICELEEELDRSAGCKVELLKNRVQELEAKLDSQKEMTNEDLRHRIQELEEERNLLCMKIEAQEASVALMNKEEEELKECIKTLERELQRMKYKSESDIGRVLSDFSSTSNQGADDKLVQKLQDELEQSKALCLSQEETICNLVQQIQKSLDEKEQWRFTEVPAEEISKEQVYEAKIKALQSERDNFRAKCIVQQRTITKMQNTSGSFLMPPIQEDEEFITKTSGSDESSDESIYEETEDDVAMLKHKMTETKESMVATLRKTTAESNRFREERDDRDARLHYLEDIIKNMTDAENSSRRTKVANSEEEEVRASWKEKIRRKSHGLTSSLLKKSKDEEERKRGDGIWC